MGRPPGPHSWYRSSPSEGGLPGACDQGKICGQVEPLLKIFVDQVIFTVILKHMRFLLGKKKEKTIGREKNKRALI